MDAMVGKVAEDRLFSNTEGGPIDGNNFRKRIFKPAAQALALTA